MDRLIEQGLTSHQTHYGSYQGRVFAGQMTQWLSVIDSVVTIWHCFKDAV